MRGLASLLALVAATACSGGTSPDAGGGDAGADGGAWPIPPAPPVLTPCPDGWREVTDASGLVTCDPWPETGYRVDCAYDEAHFPGTPGCQRVGTACPADGWPEGLPTDRPIAYVDDDAALGGDGLTRATAYASLQDAVAGTFAGTVIAVAAGRYDTASGITLRSGTVLWGACVMGVRVTSSAPADDRGAILLLAEAGLRNLSIDAPARIGVGVTGEAATVNDVVIAGAHAYGLVVQAPVGSLMAQGVVVRDTQPKMDGTRGDGVELGPGTRLVIERAVFERNHENGLIVGGATLELRDTVVRETQPRADGTRGRGVLAEAGSRLVLERVVVEQNRELGVIAYDASVLELRAALVRGTQARADGTGGGRGVEVSSGAHLVLERTVVEQSNEIGVIAGGAGTTLEVRDVVVRDTTGPGVQVTSGARLVLERTLVDGSHQAGVSAYDAETTLEARDLVVRDTALDEAGQLGIGLWAQRGAAVDASRVAIERSSFTGLASALGATVALVDAVVSGVEPSGCPVCAGESGGFGLSAHFGGALVARNFAVRDAALCGVVVGRDDARATAMDLTNGVIERAPVGACVQVDGYDTARLRDMVEYRDVGVPLQATSYELPGALPGS